MSGVYTAQELERLSGVRQRTLRHWTHERVLPRPLGYGRAARYTETHLLRAKVARHLRETDLPLRKIRDQIAKLSDDALRALVPKEAPPTTPDGVPVPPPAPDYPATAWEVVVLMDGLALMVCAERGPLVRRVASEIYRHYGTAPR